MADQIVIDKLQMKRGLAANLPLFDIAEFGFATDDRRVYIGSDTGNVELSRKADLDDAIAGLGMIPKQFDQLLDVDVTDKADGRVITWDAADSKLKFKDPGAYAYVVLEWKSGDQSARIQNALKTYGSVMLGRGVWLISKAIVMDGQVGSANYVPNGRLYGMGETATAIKVMGSGYHAVHLINNSRCVVMDLKVQDVAMGGDTQERHGIRVESCTDCTISMNWVDNIDDAGIRFSSVSSSDADRGMRNLCINNRITNVHGGSGIEIIRADYITCIANKITGCLQHGIRVNGTQGSIIQANHLWDNGQDDISIQGYSNTGVSPAILIQPAKNIITANVIYTSPGVGSSLYSKGIDVFNDTHDTLIFGNTITFKSIGIMFRSSNNQGVYDCDARNNNISSCLVGIAIMGNCRRLAVVGNRIKDWTDLVNAGMSITSSQSGIHVDGWVGFANTPGIQAEIFIEANWFSNDTDTTVRAIAVRRTSTPIWIMSNRYTIKTPATNVIEKISGTGTLNGVTGTDTNINLGWSAINMTYTP